MLHAGGSCLSPSRQCLTTPSTAPEHPYRCPVLPVPASCSLEEEITGQPLRGTERCKRDENMILCNVCLFCNRSEQDKYQESISFPVWISLQILNWNLWKLKWEKWVWPTWLSTEQVFWIVLLESSSRYRNLTLWNHCTYWWPARHHYGQQNTWTCKYQPWATDMQICLLSLILAFCRQIGTGLANLSLSSGGCI